MQKKQVAIIDIGSSKVTAMLGERGINKTFIVKGSFSYDYDGFDNSVFFDEENECFVDDLSVNEIKYKKRNEYYKKGYICAGIFDNR